MAREHMIAAAAALAALGGLALSGSSEESVSDAARARVEAGATARPARARVLKRARATRESGADAVDEALRAAAALEEPADADAGSVGADPPTDPEQADRVEKAAPVDEAASLDESAPAQVEKAGQEPPPTRGTAETVIVDSRTGAAGKLEGRRAEGADGGLRLEVSYALEGKTLTVRYRVVNGGAAPVLLFTPLRRYDYAAQAWKPDAGRVYARARRGTLELTKRLVPIPRGVSVYSPEVPYLTRLAPGSTLLETLRLPWPIAPDDPYAGARKKKAPSGPAAAERVRFSIGYLPAPSAKSAERLRRVPGTSWFEVGYGDARKQRILRSGGVSLR